MALYFFDSSALVKRYVRERGSDWVLQLTNPAFKHGLLVASITGVEVISALTRQARSGNISAADLALALALFRFDFINEYQILELSPPVLNRAMSLAELRALRGYDAVQLAAALTAHQARIALGQALLTLVSADAALNAAASAEGLLVDDPTVHP
jgi:uncharacterized protein